uniref:C2 NT-type domain-containing protein n=1 Tax=Kahliella matisi TaxID=479472 RepID=B8X445_9STIC|nr:hypothetical protein [Kahliella matisi]
MLCIKVTEHTPVYVIWQRGNKKAKTKGRLLNENVSQAVIDEKFQISTIMEVNSDGVPSKLTVAVDKGKGTLGEADLNLSEYGEGEYKIMKLRLNNCQDPDGFIEIVYVQHHFREDLDKEKKNTKKMKVDYEDKIKTLNEKINTLQTSLENTKTDLSFLHKQKKTWTQEQEIMTNELDTLNRKVNQRESDYSDKEHEAKKIKEELKELEDHKLKILQEMQEFRQANVCLIARAKITRRRRKRRRSEIKWNRQEKTKWDSTILIRLKLNFFHLSCFYRMLILHHQTEEQ